MRHIISLLMENESGALSRVAGLFSARGYNIESLNVAPTEDPSLSRMTIVTTGSEQIIEQITKQLNKLVDVVKLKDLTAGEHIERELMLVKVRAEDATRVEGFKALVANYGGKIIDESEDICTAEITSDGVTLDRLLSEIDRDDILETVRTGASGIFIGARSLRI